MTILSPLRAFRVHINKLCVSVLAGGMGAETYVRDVFLKRGGARLPTFRTVFTCNTYSTKCMGFCFPHINQFS